MSGGISEMKPSVHSLLHRPLEGHASKTPENGALEFYPNVRFTYHELNEISNRLARRGDREQSALHLHTSCRKWRKERRVLKRSLDKIGIQWQGRPEKKWLAELLANERAVGPLLVYLQSTEVGSVMG